MNKEVCQMCGILFFKPDLYRKEKDGKVNKDYCMYCYKDGEFQFKGTMDELIELCVPKIVQSHKEDKFAFFSNLKELIWQGLRFAEYINYLNEVNDDFEAF